VVTNKLNKADVELVPGLQKNLLSYVRLERKGVRLVYEAKKRYLANSISKLVEVFESGNLLLVRFDANLTRAGQICIILGEQYHPGVHEDSLYQFHVRLGHQSYAAIEDRLEARKRYQVDGSQKATLYLLC
jgi:hypothetical protein